MPAKPQLGALLQSVLCITLLAWGLAQAAYGQSFYDASALLYSPPDPELQLPGVYGGAAAWVDYDGDGHQDLLLTGATQVGPDAAPITALFHNDFGRLVRVDLEVPGVAFGGVAWADMDGDGDLDFALQGDAGHGGFLTQVYRNDGDHAFSLIPLNLPGLAFGSIDWADYDDGGDPDLLISGARLSADVVRGVTLLYRNDGGGVFTDTEANLPGIMVGEARFGNYDGNDDLDVIVVGLSQLFGDQVTTVYRNVDGLFVAEVSFGGLRYADVDVGDSNQDGDLDIVLMGQNDAGVPVANFHINRRVPEPVPEPGR